MLLQKLTRLLCTGLVHWLRLSFRKVACTLWVLSPMNASALSSAAVMQSLDSAELVIQRILSVHHVCPIDVA